METPIDVVKRLDVRLFGLDGQGGVIRRLEAADEKNEDLIQERHEENRQSISRLDKKFDKLDKKFGNAKWLVIGFIAAWGFLTGTGWASLDRVLKVLASIK